MSQTRRDFVKSTSLITGSLIAAPFLSEASMFNSLVDDTIKVALIGCGGRGTGAAIQALSTKQNVKLVAMADAFQDRLDNCYKEITGDDFENLKSKIDVPADRRFVGFDAYLKAIPLADVVILTTPPGFRPYILKQQ
jgi:predicted dehydrogenase